MKKLACFIFAIIILLINWQPASAQGCVAVRHFSSCGNTTAGSHVFLQPGEWSVNTNYRYFKSFRHFRGTEEEPQRVENNTEVINWQHAIDVSVSYPLTSRLTANATLPLVYNERSSLYEHGGDSRHTTVSAGLGDARVSASYWLLDPYENVRGNVVVGLGVRFPTGDAAAEDFYYNVGPMGHGENRPVDQSIQPGDGAFGITTELQVSRQLTDFMGIFASGFYLINPKEKNDTRTYRETYSSLFENEAYMSVADQYALRGGLAVLLPLQGWSASVGGRFEGVPVKDLVGGNEGFRRPGYIWSIDPGIVYSGNRFSIGLNVPIALERARPQSVTDREIEQITGQPRNGDAAFADYLINFDVTWRFGSPKGSVNTFY